MKRRFLSFLCVLMLIVSMTQPFSVLAAGSDVISLVSITKTEGNFAFDIKIDNADISYTNAYLSVSIYDDENLLIGVKMEKINYSEKSKEVLIEENSSIASYRIMLLDGENIVKPLCKSLKGNISADEIFASDISEEEYNDYINNIKLLTAFDVINVNNLENAHHSRAITRAEFVAVLCRAMGQEANANSLKGNTTFNDVDATHWASGYINFINNSGIISGYSDGTFAPEEKIGYEHAIKALVSALGYAPMAESMGGYPYGYLSIANEYGITDGITPSTKLCAKAFVKLIYNAMTTTRMRKTGSADDSWEILDGKNGKEYSTLLTNMNIYIASGIVGAKDIAEDTVEFSVKESSEDYEFGIAGVDTKSDGFAGLYDDTAFDLVLNINGTDIYEYETQYVNVYVKKDTLGNYSVLAVAPSTIGGTLTILSDDIKCVDGRNVEYYIDNTTETKTIKMSSQVMFSLNKGLDIGYDYDILDLEIIGEDIELKFIENTGDSAYDMIVATKYDSARVTDIDVDGDRIKLNNRWLDFDFEDESMDYVFANNKGNTLELSDFAIGDVVAVVANDTVYADAYYLKIIKLTDNTITGTVTEMSVQAGKGYVWINGVKYEDLFGLRIEDTGTFYISMTGKIFDFEGIVSMDNYAYILEAAKDSSSSFSASVWQLKLLTANGITEYKLTEDASYDFDMYKTKLGMSSYDNEWLFWDNASELDNENRLIDFKTNSKGEIKSFASVEDDNPDALVVSVYNDGYNSRTQKIDGNILADDAIVFDVTGADADDACVSDITCLTDGNEYAGLAIKLDGEVKIFVVTEGETTAESVEKEEIVTPQGYAYILEAVTYSASSFSKDVWMIKLLSADNGIVTYKLTENASEDFDSYKSSLGITGTEWFFEDNSDTLDNADRIIEYFTNSDDEICRFNTADETDAEISFDMSVYDAESKIFAEKTLDDNTAVLNVTASRADDTYVDGINSLIDGNEYEGLIVSVDGTVKFVVIISGETTEREEVEEILIPQGYAYILEAAKTSATFSADVWKIKLLTANGIAEYKLTEDASYDFDKYFQEHLEINNNSFGFSNNEYLFDYNNVDINNPARLITYKLNSKGEIRYFASAEDDENAAINIVNFDEYNSKTQKIDGNLISDDTVIFDVTDSKADNTYAIDISYLVNNCAYEGFVLKVENEVKLFVVTNAEIYLSDEKGFAIVTETKYSTINGEDVVIVNYIQDMTEGTVTFDDDSELIRGTERILAEDLYVGDVIMFVTHPKKGTVSHYAVLGQINNDGLFDAYADSLLAFGEDNEFVYGYIANEDGGPNARYELVEVGGVTDAGDRTIELCVDELSNTYSYFDTKRNVEIKTQYITEDADWYKVGSTASRDEATFFFARVIDGAVMDIYTFNTRVAGLANIEEMAYSSVYVNCADGTVITGEPVIEEDPEGDVPADEDWGSEEIVWIDLVQFEEDVVVPDYTDIDDVVIVDPTELEIPKFNSFLSE